MAAVDAALADQIRQQAMEAYQRDHARAAELSAVQVPPEGVLRSTMPGAGRDSRVVAIEDATGNAYGVRVNGDNNLGVEARYGSNAVVTTTGSAGTSSVEVVGTTTGRVQLTIQNTDDTNVLYVRLGATATSDDYRLGPGESFSLPPGASYEGGVNLIASGSSTGFVVIEFKLS